MTACIGNDPGCPCQDGDACHYRDLPGSKAWPISRGAGAFGFAAMMRAGAYTAADAEMCAAKFEALGNEIERLRALLAKP